MAPSFLAIGGDKNVELMTTRSRDKKVAGLLQPNPKDPRMIEYRSA